MDMLSMVSSAMGGGEEEAPARRPGGLLAGTSSFAAEQDPEPEATASIADKKEDVQEAASPAVVTTASSSTFLAPAASPIFAAPTTSSMFAAPTTSSIFAAPTTSSVFAAPTTSSIFAAPSTASLTSAGGGGSPGVEAEAKASSLESTTPEASPAPTGRLSMRPSPLPQPELHFSTVASTAEGGEEAAGPEAQLGKLGINRSPAAGMAANERARDGSGNVLEDFGASSIFSGFLSPAPSAGAHHTRSRTPGEKIQDMKTMSLSSFAVDAYFDASAEPAAAPLLARAGEGFGASLAADRQQAAAAAEEDEVEWSEEEEFSDSDLEDAVEEAAAELSAFTGLSESDIVGEEEWLRVQELQSWQQEVAWLLSDELSCLLTELRSSALRLRKRLDGLNEMVSYKSAAINMGSAKEPMWLSRLHGHVSVKGCAISEAEVDVKLSRDGKKHGIHFASQIAQGEHNYFTLPQLQDAGNFLDLCAAHCEDLQARQKEFSAYFRCEHADGCKISDALHHRTNHSSPIALSTNRRLLEESNSIRSHILADVTRAVTNISLLLLRARERLVKQSEIRFPDTIVGIGGKGEKGGARFAESKAPQYAYFRPRPPPELCIDIGIRDGLLVLTALTLQVSVARGKHKSKGLVGYSYKVDNLWVEVVDCEKVSCELKVVPDLITSLARLYTLCAEFRGKVTALEA